jgi:hypothetical protein
MLHMQALETEAVISGQLIIIDNMYNTILFAKIAKLFNSQDEFNNIFAYFLLLHKMGRERNKLAD